MNSVFAFSKARYSWWSCISWGNTFTYYSINVNLDLKKLQQKWWTLSACGGFQQNSQCVYDTRNTCWHWCLFSLCLKCGSSNLGGTQERQVPSPWSFCHPSGSILFRTAEWLVSYFHIGVILASREQAKQQEEATHSSAANRSKCTPRASSVPCETGKYYLHYEEPYHHRKAGKWILEATSSL